MKKGTLDEFYPFTFTDISGIEAMPGGIQTDDIVKILRGHINDDYTVSVLNIDFQFQDFHSRPECSGRFLINSFHCRGKTADVGIRSIVCITFFNFF